MNPGFVIMMLFSLFVVVLVTAMVPEISRPTVPLGVNIPSGRVKDPVVVGALRRYRWWCVGLGAVAAVGTVATMALPAWNALWLLAYVAG